MVHYEKMYRILFNKMSDIIEEIKEIQRQTEEMYIDSKDREFVLLKSGEDSDLRIGLFSVCSVQEIICT